MIAVFKRETGAYFKGVLGYLLAAFLLVFAGIYCMAYNLSGYYSNFEYVLDSIAFIYLIAVPIISMRSMAEERRQKTDQLLYALPIRMSDVVVGKYLAMLLVLAVPTVIMGFYPLVLSRFGTVALSTAYGALLGFFLLGAALLSIGLFISSLTDSQVAAAVITLVTMLLLYFMSGLAGFVSTEASASLLALSVLAVILAVVLICALGGKDGGAAAADPNLGVYTASTAEMLGVEMDITDLFEEGVSIELKENGKCAMNVNGTKGSGKWTLEDGVFHIKGGGLDCDGTLESGVMTLENMLGMGVQMTFVKEGGFTPADPDSAAGSGSAAAAAPASALQQQWAGTWYGCMYVSEATGDFAGIPSDFYDAYMVVDVDAEGKGTFAVYVAGSEEAFALANCEAKESGLYATDGTIAGGIEMYAYNWMFLPMPDYPDQYVMSDEIQDGDSSFSFSLFMKQWGGSWQKEIDSGFAIVPPSIEGYNDAIANGELPPCGFAPAGYMDGEASDDLA